MCTILCNVFPFGSGSKDLVELVVSYLQEFFYLYFLEIRPKWPLDWIVNEAKIDIKSSNLFRII